MRGTEKKKKKFRKKIKLIFYSYEKREKDNEHLRILKIESKKEAEKCGVYIAH